MRRTVSSTAAKSNLGSLLDWSDETGEPVVVEKRGHPVAAIVPYKALQEMEEDRERLRRYEARDRLRQLRAEVAERNADMRPDDVEKFADEVVRESIDSLMMKRRVRFEE